MKPKGKNPPPSLEPDLRRGIIRHPRVLAQFVQGKDILVCQGCGRLAFLPRRRHEIWDIHQIIPLDVCEKVPLSEDRGPTLTGCTFLNFWTSPMSSLLKVPRVLNEGIEEKDAVRGGLIEPHSDANHPEFWEDNE